MAVPSELVKRLRETTGAPMMECKKALEEANGDLDSAFTILRKRGQASAEKKAGRVAAEGLVGCYIHPGSRIGVIVEVNCETDFVARTDEFQQLAHDLAMQICATAPRFIRKEDVTADVLEREKAILREQAIDSGKPEKAAEAMVAGRLAKFFEESCLYEQHFIKDMAGTLTVRDLITSKIAKFGENIAVRRYSRFKVGEGISKSASESVSRDEGKP
jgi:elongation factor Ts